MAGLEVCYVVNSVGEGSIPADIAKAVTETTDNDVSILTWFDGGDFRGKDAVDVVNVAAPDGPLGIDSESYQFVRDYLRGFDVVQAHHNHSGAFAKIIARRLGIPSVSREGNTRDGFTMKGRVANGVTNPLSDRIICISRSVQHSFRRWERVLLRDDEVIIIPNGVDVARIQEITRKTGGAFVDNVRSVDNSTIVGTAAMLYEQKGLDVLIKAVALANHDTEHTVELVVAGDGPLRDDLEGMAVDLGVGDVIHFLGYTERDEVYKMLGGLDLFAMPSRWEGFCVAVAEALAAGVPCVLSDINVFRELFSDAAVYHPVDRADALETRITTLLEDEARCAQLAADGRELVSTEYDITTVARRYADVYEEVA